MPHVVVAGSIHPSGFAVLDEASDVTWECVDDPDPTAYLGRLPEADGLLLRTQPLKEADVAAAQRLRIVARHGVGFDAVEVPALSSRNIPLAIVGDVNSRSVAEHAMMFLLAASRRLVSSHARTRAGDWAHRNAFEAREILGKTLLIVGFGRIGRHLAALAAPFGVRVLVHDPFVREEDIRDYEPAPDLVRALAEADLLSVHVPKAGGRAVIGAEELAAIKPGAIVVNTARGGVIDEAALLAALENGRVALAGLDVFGEEPPAADDPLLQHERVIVTPHNAGLTLECAERMAVVSARNIVDCFHGRLDPALVVNAREISLPS